MELSNKSKAGVLFLAKRLLEDSSEDSDEDLLLLGEDIHRHVQIRNYVSQIALCYSPDDFRSHFRLNRANVENLCAELNFQYDIKAGRQPFKPLDSVLLTLWTLANQETFRTIGDRFGVARGSAYRIFIKICKKICTLKPNYIIWPIGNDLRTTVADFNNLRGNSSFPNVVGCVDGSHIAISGKKRDNSYYNRKGFHSIILQVICNSKLEFLDVFCGWSGSCHDARVWQNSPIYNRLNNENFLPDQYHLLGDTAYPINTFIMVPFKDNGHFTAQQKYFNIRLSSTRVVIEQAIGRLKEVFRRLKFLNVKKLTNIKFIVVAVCILHNYCLKYNTFDNLIQENIDIREENGQEIDEAIENYQIRENRIGRNKREHIMLQLFEERE